MLIHNADITGSLTLNGIDIGNITGSQSSIIALNQATASLSSSIAILSGSFLTTSASYSSASGSFSQRVTTIEGKYATTGSNFFNGSQTITGSLIVTNQIVAQTLNVQQISSSIVYSSGSNIFGNSLSNTQQLTGSVSITGSLTYNGANITTIGNVTTAAATGAGQVAFFNGSNVITSVSGLYFDGVDKLGVGTTNPLTRIEVYNSSEDRHFSAIGASPSLNLYSTSTNPVYGGTFGLATLTNAYIQGAAAGDLVIANRGSVSGSIIFSIGQYIGSEKMRITPAGLVGIGNNSPSFNLDVTGTARMTGNLTAASIIKSGGTSSQYLMADGSTSTLTNPVTGTGTTNYLPKWTSGTALGNSSLYNTSTGFALGNTLNGSGYALEFETNATIPRVDFIVNSVYQGQVSVSDSLLNLKTFTSIPIVFGINNTERMRLTSTGLGIGTTSPARKLHVLSGAGTAQIQSTGTSSTMYFADANSSVIDNQGFGSIGNSLWFMTNGTERARLDTSGNLGLGVVPSAWSLGTAFDIANGPAILGINNATQITNNAYYNGGWKYKASSFAENLILENDGAFKFNIAPSGTAGNAITFTQAMTLTSGGRLLLGTTTDAGYLLDVNGTGRFSNTLYADGAILGNSYIRIAGGSDYGSQLVLWCNAGGNTFLAGYDFSINTGSNNARTTKFYIAPTGAATFSSSVGIGVSPSYKLDVFANNNASIAIAESGDDPFIWFDRSDGGSNRLAWRLRENSVRGLVFETGSSSTKYGQTFSEAMRITSGGSVGIGTTSPSEKFVVSNGGSQNIEINPSFIQSFNRSSPGYAELPFYASKFSFNVGNVGIGTTSPVSKLHVAGAGNAAGGNILMGTANNSTDKWSYLVSTQYNSSTHPQGFALIGGFSTATANAVVIGGNIYETNPSTEIQFWTHTAVSHSLGGSERMRITSGGSVGIGTTSPTRALEIKKDYDQLKLSSALSSNYMAIRSGTNYCSLSYGASDVEGITIQHSNGNVGIGTTSPGEKLEVNGNILATNFNSANAVVNTADTYTGTAKITNIITLSQAEYDAIGSPSSSYLYVII